MRTCWATQVHAETQQVITVLIADYFLLDPTSVRLDSCLVGDLGADSLEILEITLALNDRFAIELPENELSSVRTVGDLCQMVAKLI